MSKISKIARAKSREEIIEIINGLETPGEIEKIDVSSNAISKQSLPLFLEIINT
jgi:hypothetical protein